MIDAVVRSLPAADRAAVAWKNGGGTTREIVCSPPGAGMADFRWRVSLADVAADGPFSTFPGVDRTLTMVEGDGMELTVEDTVTLVNSPYAPRNFAGDVATDCRLLGGPVVNFNVMWRRDALTVPPAVAVVRGRLPLAPGTTLVVALTEDGAETAGLTLGPYDAALVEGTGELHAKGPVALVTGLRAPHADGPEATR
ncbi:HutD family protein [Streptomyces kunmingensis]|uniref:HutD family protein n=1 Tax=Streptomyces kunmingensis TaxID=68225 RepID=A0ABU6C599_9ACTN|nr:HutD family protein [Streptomyces kunmingensis]MEB3959891.1 HutD family protein [Streptomyces kunmingensis]